LRLDEFKGTAYLSMLDMFNAWQHEAEKLKNGDIMKDKYDSWRYNYPHIEAERTKAEIDVKRQKAEDKEL